MTYAIDGRFIQDHFPGIGRYTFNLIAAFGQVAPDTQFRVLHNPALCNTRYDLSELRNLPNMQWQQVDVPTISLREQLGLPAARAFLLHSPYYIKPYLQRTPSIITLFDLLPMRHPAAIPNARARLLFRTAVRLAASTSAHIIVPSMATRNDLVNLLRVPPAKMTVIPLAADKHFAHQTNDSVARMRARYNLQDAYVLCLGINKPHKNLATLVHAWEKINDRSHSLVMAGSWDSRYPIEQAEGVRFIQNVAEPDLPALYAGARVLVAPSFYEGFGLTPLEAMACGTPVIASNASSLPEVVGDAALTFDPNNVDELAIALTRVLNDPKLRNDLAARSLARAAQFSWEQTARQTLAVYRSVAGVS